MIKHIKITGKNSFYYNTLQKLIEIGKININAKTLVVGGNYFDKKYLLELGFENVTISNLDERIDDDEMAPFKQEYQNAENLTFPDNSFEAVISSHCLHHCRSPHRALIEMMRVSRKMVVVFDGRDSFVSRFGLLLGTSEDYELNAVKAHGFQYGGVNNTYIPNHVYRWNEYEVLKVVKSYMPELRQEVSFFYSLDLKFYINKLKNYKNKFKYFIALFAKFFLQLFFIISPKQSNQFAFYINTEFTKERLQPWLIAEDNQIKIIQKMLTR